MNSLKLDDAAIRTIAGELSRGSYSEECQRILAALQKKDMNQTDLQRESGLSYTICREAALVLTGALFIATKAKGTSKVYRLSENGHRLIEMLKGE